MAITDNLPKGDSPSLALVHPTEAEKLMQFTLNAAEWRGALKLPAYLRREQLLSETDMTCNGGISYWILVDTSLPNELHGKMPEIKGAIVGTEKGKRVWCYWTRMWYNQDPAEAKGNTLHILRLVIEDGGWEGTSSHGNGAAQDHSHDAAIAALMAMAQREAEEWKMENVEMWAPTPAALAAAQRLDPKAKHVNRDVESIASLKWFPEHDGPVADKIDWMENEKYAWC